MADVGLALAVVVRTAQSANIEERITLFVGLALDGSQGGRGGRLRCPSDDNNFGSGSGLDGRSNLGSGSGLESRSNLGGRGGLGSQGNEGGKIGSEIEGTGGKNGRGGERGLSSGGDRSRGSR